MTFPLFHRPGSLVFLDDDPDYLEMLALVLPRQWHVQLLQRPQECIARLRQEPPFWEADAWAQQQLVDQWRAGQPLVPQLLQYWARSTERYALTRVCAVDFSMPGMDGLQLLAELRGWPGARVLLTGQADEQVAVSAFNRGLIERFVAKQMPDMSRHLVDVVQRLLATPHPRHEQIWLSTLRPQQHALLSEATVAGDLAEFASRRWVEHVVVGEPFGVLGLDAAGYAGWLQLVAPADLPALADAARRAGMPPAALDEIRAGRKLADPAVAATLQQAPELAQGIPFGSRQQLVGALMPLAQLPGASGYTQWLARQPRRQVES